MNTFNICIFPIQAFINLAGKIEPKNDSLEQDGQDIIIGKYTSCLI